MSAKQNIRTACGMLKSKTSVTKALLKERARDKKREAAKLKSEALSMTGFDRTCFWKFKRPIPIFSRLRLRSQIPLPRIPRHRERPIRKRKRDVPTKCE